VSFRSATLALFVLLAVSVAGCASLPAPARRGGVEPQVLVVLPPGPPSMWRRTIVELEAAHDLYLYQAWVMVSLDRPCVVYGVEPGESVERVLRRLATDPRVESAQAVQRFDVLAAAPAQPPAPTRPPARPGGSDPSAPAPPSSPPRNAGAGDPYAHLQHGAAAVRAGEAHRWATGRGVTVAVVDTGVDFDHPDLAGRVEKVGNFVDHDRRGFTRDVHGTAVAGVVAAVENNGVGIAGVAPDARLLAFKACWPRSTGAAVALCDSYTLAQAVDAAVSAEADVLLLSLAGPPDALLARLLGVALRRGASVVAAVDESRPGGGFPASLPGVVAVRAAPVPGTLAGGAQVAPPVRERPPPRSETGAKRREARRGGTEDGERRGPPPGAVLAPGVDVLTTVPGGGYDFQSGSSMAAAHVAGVAALLLEARPGLAPEDLARRLAESAGEADGGLRRAGSPAGGSAIVNACAAVTRLLAVPDGCRPGAAAAGR
jgi:subtilisin family serine protease